jgi:lysozyme
MTLSENGINLIKFFEGKETLYSLLPEFVAYKCPGDVWTIGWGTTIYPDKTFVKQGDTCIIQQARRWLLFDLNKVENELIPYLNNLNLNQGQYDSIVSFSYNTGVYAFYTSTIFKTIKTGGIVTEDMFIRWNKATADHDGKDNDGDGLIDEPGEKKMLTGLTNRRRAEFYLYQNNKLNILK